MAHKAVKITIYINEADEWQHRPLYLEFLEMLYAEGLSGGTVLRGVAGFTGAGGIETSSLVDAGSKLPLVIEFVDSVENVERIMPTIRRMAGKRLITREEIEIV